MIVFKVILAILFWPITLGLIAVRLLQHLGKKENKQ